MEEYYRALEKNAIKVSIVVKPAAGAGWCGSGGGKKVPGEPDSKGKGNADKKDGEGKSSGGRTEIEIARVKRQVAEAIQKAAKGRGTIPGGWARWANDQLQPAKVRWQDKLARMTRGSLAYRPGVVDFHYTRPSRRQGGLGFGPGVPILPAYRAPVPQVAFITDTSGSMGTSELQRCAAEGAAVLKATGANINFIAVDAEVHACKSVKTWQEMVSLFKGGGGTNLTPAFDAVAKLKQKPDLIIFATDGGGPVPPTPPKGIRTIWLLVGKHRVKPCQWGEVVEVDD
jgi:predicted metal-dependent peptidase